MNTIRQFYRVRLGTYTDTIKLPSSLFANGERQCGGRAMTILTDLIYRYGEQKRSLRLENDDAMVTVPLRTLTTHTGCSKTRIPGYVQEITTWVRKIKNSKENEGNVYIFMNPKTGLPVPSSEVDEDRCLVNDGPQVIANSGQQYFIFPECMLTSDEHWSLRHMTNSEMEAYYNLWWTADHAEKKTSGNAWAGTVAYLRKSAKQDAKTFEKAMEGLRNKGLVRYTTIPAKPGRSAEYTIELLNPETGNAFAGPDDKDEDDDQNYRVDGVRGFRSNPNPSDRSYTKNLLKEWGYTGPMIDNANCWVQILCPFHDDTNPSCGVTPHGFRCRTCEATGALRQLAQKFGRVIFVQPANNAIASWPHRNEEGYTIYRVARYPDIPDGRRDFKFERKLRRRWVAGYKGKKTLYNLDLIQDARTVILTEGHKDADTATNLNFTDEWNSPIIGCTSGGKDSWQPKFAKQFQGHRVIFIPDTDEPGETYRNAVKASFDAEGVDYIEVILPGVKDLTEYRELPDYSHEELARLIGHGWIGGVPGNDKINFGRTMYYDATVEV
jgi:hypothetical protein